MFTPLTASSLAQHNQLDAMIAEAIAAGQTVEGLLTDNPYQNYARFVLVFDDQPDTGGDFDRVFSFEGEEVARGEGAVALKIEQFATQVEDALAGLAAQSA